MVMDQFESGISELDPKLVLWILGSRYPLRAVPNFNLDFYAQIPRVDPNLVFWGVFFIKKNSYLENVIFHYEIT